MVTMTKVPEVSHSILEEIITRLVREIEPERVYLFGSRARGDFESGSDFDLLIVVSESELPGYKRDRIALRALRGLGVAVDVIVLTRVEFERKLDVVCSLAATVHREGKLLYAA
jgi:predicted nucleotidyltransferase